MKNFTFKLLQQLNKKKADKGFTLIELLVVIIIIGILSAIALPAFLNQAAKARQSEAKQALSSAGKGQQAYYLEQQQFSNVLGGLGLGLSDSTENFAYGTVGSETGGRGEVANAGAFQCGATVAPTPADCTTNTAYLAAVASDQQAVRDYAIGVVVFPETADGAAPSATNPSQTTTTTILCEETAAGTGETVADATTAAVLDGDTAYAAADAATCGTAYRQAN